MKICCKVRAAIFGFLATMVFLSSGCSPDLPPGTVALTITFSGDGAGKTGTLRYEVRADDVNGELHASGSAAGYTTVAGTPKEYSYSGAGEGMYAVIAWLDVDDNGSRTAGDVISATAFPVIEVISEQTTPVTINLDTIKS